VITTAIREQLPKTRNTIGNNPVIADFIAFSLYAADLIIFIRTGGSKRLKKVLESVKEAPAWRSILSHPVVLRRGLDATESATMKGGEEEISKRV
jgi:hypothetical protein